MCRRIKVLKDKDHNASHQEVHDASLQYIRKISGMRKPSKVNEKAFEKAIQDISRSSEKFLNTIK